MAYVIGLTGGIGSGKSFVAQTFAARDVDVLDTDAVAHAITRVDEPGYRAVVERFGAQCVRPDRTLDRAWLRDRAFTDPGFRADLEAALHPLIAAQCEREVATWRSPYGLLVVPLLFERGGLRGWVSRVLVVDCPEEVQVERVVVRSNLAPEEVRRIMATQLTRSERVARADDVIDNSGLPEDIEPQVIRLDTRYRALAADAASKGA
jgi:dephospho-CoA kinase